MRLRRPILAVCLLPACVLTVPLAVLSQDSPKPSSPTPSVATPAAIDKQPIQKEPTERQQLQKAIEEAANDRAALVKNLEAFLKKFPETSERPQIYRALVESSLQLRDFSRAVDYSERLVSLKPDDVSNTVLTIQLLNRYGDAPGYRRAVLLLQPRSGVRRSYSSDRKISACLRRRLGKFEKEGYVFTASGSWGPVPETQRQRQRQERF